MKKLLLLVLLVLIVLLVLFFFGGHSDHEHGHGGDHHGEKHSEEMNHKHESSKPEEETQSKLHANHQMDNSVVKPVAGAAKLVEVKSQYHMEHKDGLSNAELNVSNGWVRETIPGTNVTAAYLDISSSKPLNVFELSSPDFERVEIHDMTLSESGVMTMVKLESLLVDESGVSLSPNGKHIMLINPTRAIKVGETVEVTLKAGGRLGGNITIQLPVVSGN